MKERMSMGRMRIKRRASESEVWGLNSHNNLGVVQCQREGHQLQLRVTVGLQTQDTDTQSARDEKMLLMLLLLLMWLLLLSADVAVADVADVADAAAAGRAVEHRESGIFRRLLL